VNAPARYRAATVGGCVDATLEAGPDGTQILRSTEALRWFPDRLTDSLEQGLPRRPIDLVAKRDHGGDWRPSATRRCCSACRRWARRWST
jgi:feruloyl-CoA synthase